MDTMKINQFHITDVRGLTINGGALCLVDAGTPSSLPSFVGQTYYDTTGEDLYIAIAMTGTANDDWKISFVAAA